MAYLGRSPIAFGFAKLDNIVFDGTSTVYPLFRSGVPYLPGSALGLTISVAGVIQEPQVDYTVASSNIIFAVAPPAGVKFFGIGSANQYAIGSVSDGSITTAKLQDSSVTNIKIGETISIAKGGTGATSAASARTNLGLGTVAFTDASQTFTGVQRGASVVNNTVSFSLNVANNFKSTPTVGGALTFTNLVDGQSGFILLVKTSSLAITAAATTKISSANLNLISTTGTFILSYFCDGTNVYVSAGATA